MAERFITIGIPTYNRADAVAARIDELLDADLPDDVEILVIDNASSDDTVVRLRGAGPRVRVLSNPANLGYGGNFLRLFAECRTDYLTVVSDEDRIEPVALRALIAFCRDRRPVFVSPRADVHGNPSYRGQATSGPIAPERFKDASFYVSGLTFEMERGALDAQELEPLLASNSAVAIYPQVLMAALAAARQNAVFFGEVVTTHMEHRPTSITELAGGIYNRVPGRWVQALGFETFFEGKIAASDPAEAARYRAMRDRVRAEFFGVLITAIRRESPALADAVRRSVSVPARLRHAIGSLLSRRGRSR